MKNSKWIGIIACIVLMVSCFMPWAYYPDLGKNFTGFYSEDNSYGKPGKFLAFFAVVSGILIILPRIWAKRLHLFLAALFVGYAIKTYVLFASCYNTFCPEKKAGIFLMMGACFVLLAVAIFPDFKLKSKTKQV